MSIRVHTFAKELNLSSKGLIDRLKSLKIKVKGHMSSLDDEAVALIKKEFKVIDKKKPVVQKASLKKVAVKKTKPEKKPKAKPEKPLSNEISQDIHAKEEQTKTADAKIEKEVIKGITEKPHIGPELKILKIGLPSSVKDLSVKLQIKPSELIKRLLNKRILVTINQTLTEDVTNSIAEEFGYKVEKLPTQEEALVAEHEQEDSNKLRGRAPIVTFMGHVDHGKTSLLDMIRKTKVVDKEAGGITQHIGAYEVKLDKGKVTFLDTPGHAAFTAMRARGANITDIVVLVVAADDGIMPQTIEAIDHAIAAEVPILVAINKIDKQNINLDKVKKQLVQHGLNPEEWGGKTITVGVSAKTGQGIDELLDMLLLEAEMLELKADPDKPAMGVVVEAELSKGKGSVATVLITNGTLKIGDIVIAGLNYGKVKAIFDDKGLRVEKAGPSKPVEVLGLSGVPSAGEKIYVVNDEKKAKDIITSRQLISDKKKLEDKPHKITLEDLYSKIQDGEVKELKIVLKADVQGSLGAIKDSFLKFSSDEVKLSIIHGQVGNINESDIMLASASNAVVLGFHVDIMPNAKALSKQEGVDVRLYNIIYEAVNDVKAAMEGLLEPIVEENFLGRAEVRQIFKVSKVGIVAGSFVLKGKIPRDAVCKVIRNKEVVYKGKITSLKHFKDDIKEAREGFECGISFSFNDIKKGDLIEAIEVKETARRLK